MRGRFVVPFLSLLLFGFSGGPLSAQNPFRVGVAEGTERLEPLVSAIYAEMGLRPEFVRQPSDRVIAGLESGVLDADVGRAADVAAQMKHVAVTTVPYIRAEVWAVFASGRFPHPLTSSDLASLRLAEVRGTRMVELFAKQQGLVLSPVANLDSLAQFVGAGRADVGLITNILGWKRGPESLPTLQVQTTPLFAIWGYHVFHERWAALVPRWDAAVRKLKADGRLDKLIEELSSGMDSPGQNR